MSRLLAVTLFALSGCLAGCGGERVTKSTTPKNDTAEATPPRTASAALFENVAAKAGVNFKHDLGNRGRFYFYEFTAPGCAFVDYDNDDYPDIFLVQSGSSEPARSVKNRPYCALYHNNRDGTFSEVTAGSGLDKDLGYAQGIVTGDYDNDGYADLFITAYGGNHLFRNQSGSGKFEDVTKSMGLDKVHGTGYATSAAWGDYDNDGKLDLYVSYYARWTHALNKDCPDSSGELDYCQPQLYQPVTHQLFHNAGTRFVDVSDKAGISKVEGRGLAVTFLDFNNDGRQDIFVANDLTSNILWRNEGNGTFVDVAAQVGCAYDGQGRAMASMGIAVGDYNHSGRQSLYVSNFSSVPNILFQNQGGDVYQDTTLQAKLGLPHLDFLSFGCAFLDYDADSWPDLIVNNGHVQARKSQREAGLEHAQRKQLLRNQSNGTFREITDPALLGDLSTTVVGRGLAVGDYDNDGKVDVLAVAQNAPAQLLKNQTRNNHHWVSFKTVGTKSNRDGIGARFELKAGGARQTAQVRAGSSYLSSNDPRLYFGLGQTKQIAELIIQWPSGTREVLRDLAADTFYTVTEGQGVTGEHPPQSK